MSSRAKAKDEARRARVAEMRRAELARKRRIQIVSIVSVVVLVVAVIVGAVVLTAGSGDDSGGSEAAKPQAGDMRGEKVWEDLSQTHVTGDVDYPMSPPVGGEHHRIWADCDGTVYDEELVDEEAVHSLEHGAVWVTYTDKAGEKDIQALEERVSSTPYSLMSPYQDQTAPITLTAWGHQLGVDSATDPRVERFFSTYVQGKQTPEVGASCTAPQ